MVSWSLPHRTGYAARRSFFVLSQCLPDAVGSPTGMGSGGYVGETASLGIRGPAGEARRLGGGDPMDKAARHAWLM